MPEPAAKENIFSEWMSSPARCQIMEAPVPRSVRIINAAALTIINEIIPNKSTPAVAAKNKLTTKKSNW